MARLRIGSLFSGIGGLELGLEVALGGEVVWQVEQDEYCRSVLERHWPEAGRFSDVRTVGAANLERVDLICGGFPCQDISIAGRGGGLAGEQSGLWWEFARIIRELGPRFVVVENVSALTSRGLDAVLGEMAESGYNAEWDIISAASVGAWHRRERLFIVAYAGGGGGDSPGGEDCEALAGPDVADPEVERLEAVGSESGGAVAEVTRPTRLHQWATEPGVGRVADGVPGRVDKLKALGNAVVPQCAYMVGQRVRSLLGDP